MSVRGARVRVSVVVAAYNEEKYLGGLLAGLGEQDYRGGYEVIVVDNASSDGTSRVARSFGVRVVVEERRGVSRALNRGCREASGEIICLTDADSRVEKDWVSRLMQYYEDLRVVGVGGGFVFYDAPGWLDRVQRMICRISPRLLIAEMSGANMSFRKSAYGKIGGFDERMVMHQDNVMGRELKKMGKVVFDPGIVVRTSARRYKQGVGRLLREVAKRGVNAASLKMGRGQIFNECDDIR